MKLKLIAAAFMLFAGRLAIGQKVDFNDYQPLKSGGSLPNDVTTTASAQYKKEVETLKKKDYGNKINKDVKQDFLLQNSYLVNTLLLSGKVLYNDPVGEYVNKVADEILENDDALKKKIRVYVLKTDEVNAFATHQGLVFVTIGLLAQLNNEAELAFILCHEFIHVRKEHVISGYVEKKKIEKREGKYYDVDNFNDAISKISSFSRDQESEADVEGFNLFKKTGYAHKSIDGVFDVLEYSYLPFDEISFSPSIFESRFMKFPKKMVMADSVVKSIQGVSDKKKKKSDDEEDEDEDGNKKKKKKKSDEVDEEVDEEESGEEEVNTSTHPEIPDRRKELDKKYDLDGDSKRKKYIVSEKEFLNVRKMARYEVCRIYMIEQEYEKALYSAYILLQSNPHSVYLNRTLGHALYALERHLLGDGRNTFKEVHHKYKGSEGFIQQVFYFIEKLSKDKSAFSTVTLKHLWDIHLKFPDDKDISNMASQVMWDMVKENKLSHDDFLKEAPMEKVKEEKKEGEEEDSKYTKIKKKKKKEKEKAGKNAFTKMAFIDFGKDEEFADSFAAAEKRYRDLDKDDENLTESEKKAIRKKERKEKQLKETKGYALGVNKIMLLDPEFTQVDLRKDNPVKLQAGEEKMRELDKSISKICRQLNLDVIHLNSKDLKSGDAEKLNDISILGDWINEYYRADGLNIVTTEMPQLRNIMKKYDTKYMCLVNVKLLHEKKEDLAMWWLLSCVMPLFIPYAIINSFKQNITTYFNVYVVNLESGEVSMVVHRKVKGNASRDLMNAHLYDIFNQVKFVRK